MKVLPCANPACAGDRRQMGRRLFGRSMISLPSGRLHIVGAPSGFPMVIKCGRCLRPTKFTAAAFNALPDLTLDQLRLLRDTARDETFDAVTKPWRSQGLSESQAVDLLRFGVSGPAALEAAMPSLTQIYQGEMSEAVSRDDGQVARPPSSRASEVRDVVTRRARPRRAPRRTS